MATDGPRDATRHRRKIRIQTAQDFLGGDPRHHTVPMGRPAMSGQPSLRGTDEKRSVFRYTDAMKNET